MNYYAEWWDRARKLSQSGTVFTKPVYTKKLEKELGELKTQQLNFQQTTEQLAVSKAKLKQTEKQLAELTKDYTKLSEEKEALIATFLQEKQQEKVQGLTGDKKSTVKVRKEIEFLETLQAKDKEIKELKTKLANYER